MPPFASRCPTIFSHATSNALVGVRLIGPLPLGFGGGGAAALFVGFGPRLPILALRQRSELSTDYLHRLLLSRDDVAVTDPQPPSEMAKKDLEDTY